VIKVVLCDDHAMVHRGIRDTLAALTDIEVVGQSGSSTVVLEVIRATP